MDRWTSTVLRHRWIVVVAWVLIFIAGGALAKTTTSRLTFDFSLPGQPGFEANQKINAEFGNGGFNQPYVAMVTVPKTSSVVAEQGQIDAVFADIQAKVKGVRVVDKTTSGGDPSFVTKDGRSTYALVYPPEQKGFSAATPDKEIVPILKAAGAAHQWTTTVTGYNVLANGGSSDGPSLLVETLLGGLGALAVLLFVFASFLALVPLLVAAVSILATFLVLLGVTYLTDVSFIVQFLVALIGLGVAVDYSLLLVTRWREERAHGRENHDAVAVAMRTAGHAVVSSAGTVAISLLALLVIPVPFLRSMGIGGMLIPVVSTLVVLTLLPAMLSSIGPRVDWPRIRHETAASRAWSRWARLIVRRRWWAAGVALLMLAVLVAPVFSIRIGTARTDSLASSGPAYEGLTTLRNGGVPAGIISPLDILVDGKDPAATAAAVVAKARTVEGVATAYAPRTPNWQHPGQALVSVIPVEETVDSQQAAVVDRIRSALAGTPGVVGIAGVGSLVQDYIAAVYKSFPLVLLLIAVVTFLLLVRAFRSILLPLKAVLLNVISVAATFGATVWFWQQGHGSEQIFGIQGTGATTFWLPIIIFAFLFGLSMDYEVFILARMREEYDNGRGTNGAVIEGLGRTGRLVTCAALILFLAFLALASSPGTDIKVLGTALGVGILLDATIVRALLVPALVSLFGEWNWWLPDWVARVLRIPAVPGELHGQHARESTLPVDVHS